jgi:hypothetical protein
VVIAGFLIASHNRAVTGSALQLPYQLYESKYTIVPSFLWQPLRPSPEYGNPEMWRFYVAYVADYTRQRSLSGFLSGAVEKLMRLSLFFQPITLLPLLLLPSIRRLGFVRIAAAGSVLVVLAVGQVTWLTEPHYLAPAMGLWLGLVVVGLREMRRLQFQGRPLGRDAAAAIPIVFVITAIGTSVVFQDPAKGWHYDRQRIQESLEADGQRHLVVVRYRPSHGPHAEWVYNGADLERAPVVWARELGCAENDALLSHYGERRAWLVEADVEQREVVPYRGCAEAARISSATPGP